jgi:hypothetical protein
LIFASYPASFQISLLLSLFFFSTWSCSLYFFI